MLQRGAMASALLLSTLFWAENGFASEITEAEEAPYFVGSLPRDAYLEVMKKLPSHTIARMGLASPDMRGVAEEGLTQLVEDMTLNNRLKAPVQWAVSELEKPDYEYFTPKGFLGDMPHLAVGRALRKLMNKDGFVALPFHSDLEVDLRNPFVRDHAGTQILYKTIFKRDYTQNRREVALAHVQAILPFGALYVVEGQNEAGRTKFAAKAQEILRRNRTHDEPSRPYVSILDSNEITADLLQSLKAKPSTLVLTDDQIDQIKINITLNDLSRLFATHPEHRLMLTIDSSGLTINKSKIYSGRTGNRLFRGKAGLVLSRDLLPENVHHLVLTNPKGTVDYLDSGILWMHQGLRTVDCHGLNQVTLINGRFLDSMPALEFVDLSGFRNLQNSGFSLLSSCPRLRTVKFPASSMWQKIDYGSFIGCRSLESLDLTPLSSLTDVRARFLEGCTSLSDEEIAKVMQFLADRDINWRPDMNS